MKLLEGKAAIITGSSQGVGRAIAMSMAAHGAKVIVNNRKPDPNGPDAESVAQEIRSAGGIAVPVYGDVSDETVCQTMIATCLETFGSVDILVNNAGWSPGDDIHMFEESTAIDLFRLGVCGTIYLCRGAIPYMQKQGYGRIMNMSSITALQQSWKYTTTYTTVKSAIYGLTRLLARTYGHDGITANILMPEASTRLTDVKRQAVMEQAIRSWYANGTISQETMQHIFDIPEPEVNAAFYTYLASPSAGFINGKTFKVSDAIELLAEPEVVRAYRKPSSQPLWTVEDFTQGFAPFLEGIPLCPPFSRNASLGQPSVE